MLTEPSVGGKPSVSLDDDGYYWFLHPLFEELAAATGQYIDLYGYAAFAGPNLDALEGMLSSARRLVEAQPESWTVDTGTQLPPVHRADFLRLLGIWDEALARARQTGRPIVCFGD